MPPEYASTDIGMEPSSRTQGFLKVFFNVYDYYDALCICFVIMTCAHGPCIAALHVWVALTVPGCVQVCLRFAVGVGSSGVCMFHVLILMFILVLKCEEL